MTINICCKYFLDSYDKIVVIFNYVHYSMCLKVSSKKAILRSKNMDVNNATPASNG